MMKKLGRKQLVLASLVLALGAAVYLNWQFTGANKLPIGGGETSSQLGAAQLVNNTYMETVGDDMQGSQQANAPVDAFATPEPWYMPGYDCPVVMAAGAFIQGSSIELSCDGPMRPPYIGFLQGGLTYEAGKLGVMAGAKRIMESQGSWK